MWFIPYLKLSQQFHTRNGSTQKVGKPFVTWVEFKSSLHFAETVFLKDSKAKKIK